MFIVLESIDGGGKGRQRIEVSERLHQDNGIDVKGIEFPVHNAFYEVVVHPALQEEVKMNGPSWVLSYLLDKTLAAPEILPYVGNKENIYIADGYFTTTIAYQSFLMGQVPLEKLLVYAKDFEIPTPDLAIFLDVDPEIAFKRKEIEEGHDEGLDMFEKSVEKQKKLREIFKKMVNEKIYCDWDMVNGDGTIEEVTEEILGVLKKRVII
jgi:thymidylate kinase